MPHPHLPEPPISLTRTGTVRVLAAVCLTGSAVAYPQVLPASAPVQEECSHGVGDCIQVLSLEVELRFPNEGSRFDGSVDMFFTARHDGARVIGFDVGEPLALDSVYVADPISDRNEIGIVSAQREGSHYRIELAEPMDIATAREFRVKFHGDLSAGDGFAWNWDRDRADRCASTRSCSTAARTTSSRAKPPGSIRTNNPPRFRSRSSPPPV
ncbi:MAG: hypothetical protein R3E96_05455 [Planctomycetota bacterium]